MRCHNCEIGIHTSSKLLPVQDLIAVEQAASPEPKEQEPDNQNDGHYPPKPVNSMRHGFVAEFLLDELVVIEFLIRQIQPHGKGFLRTQVSSSEPHAGTSSGLLAGLTSAPQLGQIRGGTVQKLSPNPSILFVGFEFQAHQHVIMRDRLHCL